MNTLSIGAGSSYGPEVGAANNYQMGMLHLHIASNSLAFTAASYMKVFFVPSITTLSGAAYATYTGANSNAYKLAEPNYYAATIMINPATQSAAVVDEQVPYVPIPLGFFKTILVNSSGLVLPASGNTLDLYPTPTQY